VEFVVDKVAMGMIFLSPVIIIQKMLHYRRRYIMLAKERVVK
jgi:hypothetical protein